METSAFLKELASKAPVPGGGGVSALLGSLSAALASMVSNLTTGKKKYAAYEDDIQEILKKAEISREKLYALIEADAAAFEPLSKAYGLSKEDPNRDAIMEDALFNACQPPLEIMRETYTIIDLLEELVIKGSRLAISDVGVAATAARAALEGAIMNVIINTKSMKNRETAKNIDEEAKKLLLDGVKRCEAVYTSVTKELVGE